MEKVEQVDRDCRDDLVRLIKEGVLDRAGKREINIADVESAFIQRIARHRSEATRANDEEIARLFDAIAHGDEEHRAWLKEAIDAHFAGKEVPRPRGSGRKEAEIARLKGALEHIVSVCPDETGGMSDAALAGLLFNVETAARKALGDAS